MAVSFEFAAGWDILKIRRGASIPPGAILTKAEFTSLTVSFPKAAVLRRRFG
jgi:hypothetical protein